MRLSASARKKGSARAAQLGGLPLHGQKGYDCGMEVSGAFVRIAATLLACSTPLVGQMPPHIAAVVSAADSASGIALGGLATIYGTGLSDAAYTTGPPWPTQLGHTQVLACNTIYAPIPCAPMGVLYAGPTQINFYIPGSFVFTSAPTPGVAPGVPSAAIFSVTMDGVSDDAYLAKRSMQFNLATPAPRIFFEGYDCFTDTRFQDANESCGLTLTQGPTHQATRGAVTDQQGHLLTSSNLARIGQYYTVWMTGLGPFQNGKPGTSMSMGLTNIPEYQSGKLLPGDGYRHGVSVLRGTVCAVSGLVPGEFSARPSFTEYGPGPISCAQYDWELTISIGQGTPGPYGNFASYANLVQIPIVVYPSDLGCVQ